MVRLNNTSGGSSTMVIEMPRRSLQSGQPKEENYQVKEDNSAGALPIATMAGPQLQRWNSPRKNIWRCFATFYSFVVLGANDAAYGALIPYLETWYNVSYTIVSLVFLSPIIGYTMAALLNNHIHTVYGQRGVSILMSLAHLAAYSLLLLSHTHFVTLTLGSRYLSASPVPCLSGSLHPRRLRKWIRRQRMVC